MILVIDDLRTFNFEAVYARTSEEGLYAIGFPWFNEIWLDHDLGGDDTVMPVVLRLEEMGWEGIPYPANHIVVHSSNPPGVRNIRRALERYYYVHQVDALKYIG